MNENTLGLFQHFLNNVLLSTCTHFLGNSSEHLLVDTDTLKETCRHINQTRQKKKKEWDTNLLNLNKRDKLFDSKAQDRQSHKFTFSLAADFQACKAIKFRFFFLTSEIINAQCAYY